MKRCPNCYKDWIRENTNTIVIRLLSKATRRRNTTRNKELPLKHVIISPSPSLYNLDFLELRDLALQYLYAKTISKPSGAFIFHAFRPNWRYFNERREERRDEDESLEEELKKWEWIRSKSNWYDYVEYSPHFHFVGYIGWLNPPERGENFVYKTVTENRKVKTLNRDKKGLFRLIYYLLSHTCDKVEKSRYFHSYVFIGKYIVLLWKYF